MFSFYRDYDKIGEDFINLDFIPRGTDTAPLIPALTRVFEAALAGGGAKSINFQDLAADLAEITFKFPFKIPPYFALIIRAISVLEGIALVGNPSFAIVDEAYPFISRRLLTDPSPRGKAALKYMVYGRSNSLDVERLIDILQALEKFIAVKDFGDGSSFKMDGVRGNTYVGKAGDAVGTKVLTEESTIPSASQSTSSLNQDSLREALKFFFSNDGELLRSFVIDEIANGFDAFSRSSFRRAVTNFGVAPPQSLLDTIAPSLTQEETKLVNSTIRLVSFFTGNKELNYIDNSRIFQSDSGATRTIVNNVIQTLQDDSSRERFLNIFPFLQEYSSNIQEFASALARRITKKASDRFIEASLDLVFGKAK